MRFVKSISLFVVYPLLTAVCGFALGFGCGHIFYDGKDTAEAAREEMQWQKEQAVRQEAEINAAIQKQAEPDVTQTQQPAEENILQEVAAISETLSVDTEYVLEETDIDDHSTVETVWRLPAKYVGMDREQFLEAMELYESFPPLSEQERGFVGLEVLSFSKDRVVVQMNYQYVKPSTSFYLAAKDHEVVVYLEDQETIYMYTGISLERLPETMQLQIMQMMWVEDEESLYDFLETYSS